MTPSCKQILNGQRWPNNSTCDKKRSFATHSPNCRVSHSFWPTNPQTNSPAAMAGGTVVHKREIDPTPRSGQAVQIEAGDEPGWAANGPTPPDAVRAEHPVSKYGSANAVGQRFARPNGTKLDSIA